MKQINSQNVHFKASKYQMKAVQFSVSFAFSDTPQQCYKVSNKHLKQERKKKKNKKKQREKKTKHSSYDDVLKDNDNKHFKVVTNLFLLRILMCTPHFRFIFVWCN